MFDFWLFLKKNDRANPIENVKILCKILNRVSVPGFGFKNFQTVGFGFDFSGSGSNLKPVRR